MLEKPVRFILTLSNCSPMTPKFIPDLVDIQQELFELPQRVRCSLLSRHLSLTVLYLQERVTYNKEIQTADLESDTGATSDEEVREPITREREATVEPERGLERLEEESATLDREIEEEIRGLSTITLTSSPLNECTDLTEEERTSILAAPEFLDFVEQSSKIVQRALNDNYDYIRDYTSGAETGGWVRFRVAILISDSLSPPGMTPKASASNVYAPSGTSDIARTGLLQM